MFYLIKIKVMDLVRKNKFISIFLIAFFIGCINPIIDFVSESSYSFMKLMFVLVIVSIVALLLAFGFDKLERTKANQFEKSRLI